VLTLTTGSFDSSVHISEEASNAATAVPWAIVGAISIAGLLGWGEWYSINIYSFWPKWSPVAINIALAFCMGQDLQALSDSNQPMAQILFNSFGQKGTLGIWVLVVIVQCAPL
jgi:amino acid transporter